MNHRIVAAAAFAALTAASAASAGIIFVPVGGRFIDPESTPLQVRERAGQVRIDTSDLHGQLDCADQPPDQTFIALSQNIRLNFDPRDGKVSGTVLGSMDWASAELALRGNVDGVASCFPLAGDDCGSIVVDLDIRAMYLDGSDVGVGVMGMLDQRLLGSLVRDGDFARWVSIEADVRLGGPEDVVALALSSMSEGESCQM